MSGTVICQRGLGAAVVAVVAFATLALSAAPIQAQEREPRLVAVAVAECFSATMRDGLTGPAWIEERADGWRVVVPLRGQPEANREVQSPPPDADVLTWFDLRRYDDAGSLPEDWNPILPYRVNTSAGIYIVDGGGYGWLRPRRVSQLCLEATTGGVYQPLPD